MWKIKRNGIWESTTRWQNGHYQNGGGWQPPPPEWLYPDGGYGLWENRQDRGFAQGFEATTGIIDLGGRYEFYYQKTLKTMLTIGRQQYYPNFLPVNSSGKYQLAYPNGEVRENNFPNGNPNFTVQVLHQVGTVYRKNYHNQPVRVSDVGFSWNIGGTDVPLFTNQPNSYRLLFNFGDIPKTGEPTGFTLGGLISGLGSYYSMNNRTYFETFGKYKNDITDLVLNPTASNFNTRLWGCCSKYDSFYINDPFMKIDSIYGANTWGYGIYTVTMSNSGSGSDINTDFLYHPHIYYDPQYVRFVMHTYVLCDENNEPLGRYIGGFYDV